MSKVREKSKVSGDSEVGVVTHQFPRELGVLLADRQMSIPFAPFRYFLERPREAALLGVALDDPVPFKRLPPVVREPKETECLTFRSVVILGWFALGFYEPHHPRFLGVNRKPVFRESLRQYHHHPSGILLILKT